MSKQQKQTKIYFNKKAKNWPKKSIRNSKRGNTGIQRNQYVLEQIKKYKLSKHLDVACGSGDLSFRTSKITRYAVGIDFSEQMIKIAKKRFQNFNLQFFCSSIFDYETEKTFDCISANGFIEYLSLNQIETFFEISFDKLSKNGLLIFGSRNRLFNLFSLNKFSQLEHRQKTFKNFYEESISLVNLNLNKYLKLSKNKFSKVSFKQPKTGGVNVEKRHQFSPLQLVDILKKKNFRVIDIYPINFHPVSTSVFHKDINYKFFSKYLYFKKIKNKLPLIPFSSTFMITAKKAS